MLGIARFWFPALTLSIFWALLSQPAQKHLVSLSRSKPEEPANVLLLTAHPDDECMFFAPTILALLGQEGAHQRPDLHSLCLSVGNADGLGDLRRRELARSLDILGIEDGRRWVVDTPELQDNFTAEWSSEDIANVLRPYVTERHISTILTFDHQGISSHPNHISLPRGAAHLLSTLPSTAEKPRPRLFSLVTVPLREKYLGPISPIFTKLAMLVTRLSHASNAPETTTVVATAETAIAVSGWDGYVRALSAMMEHRSQLVWFRWLYVSFSRYMWVNEWVEVLPPSEVQTASAAEP
ncbi:LmbE-like protein [Trametes meyenii]|nr:LmbE-like protein [Trametes meyenii]